MTFSNKLKKLDACPDSLKWVGNKTIKQAWETCENSNWMLWFLTKTDLDLIDPVCDMAEEVLDLVPEESQLACIWAISAARRRANRDELKHAYSSAIFAAYSGADYGTSYYAANAAANAAAVAGALLDNIYSYHSDYAISCASSSAAARCTICADTAYIAAENKERKKQCDILRKYFTIDQVKEAFNKLVAQLS